MKRKFLTFVILSLMMVSCKKETIEPKIQVSNGTTIELSNDSQFGTMRNTVIIYTTTSGYERNELYNNTNLVTIDSVDLMKPISITGTNGVLTSQGWIQTISCIWQLKGNSMLMDTQIGEYYNYIH